VAELGDPHGPTLIRSLRAGPAESIRLRWTIRLLGVGRQMGHASPVTTAVYVPASDEVANGIAAAVAR
jgi:integrase